MANQTVECVACGHVGATKLRGSIFITIILLFFYIIPGIIYMIWRRGGRGCSACGSSNVKLYNPQAKNQQHQPQIQHSNVQQIQCPDCRELIRYDARKCKHCGSMVE
jgi:DNA-directed RNA polymerase subunit RPC12/RpoP